MEAETILIKLGHSGLLVKLYRPVAPKALVIVGEAADCPRMKVEYEKLWKALMRKNIATLFTYLLDPPEDQRFDIPFDIDRMSMRLQELTEWVNGQRGLQQLGIGYFTVNTAAAAAVQAAAAMGGRVGAVVSHCGRADLAGPSLAKARSAILLITSSDNVYLTELNWQAYGRLRCEKELVTMEGGPRSFEKGRNARRIARLSADWFDSHLLQLPVRRRVANVTVGM